MIFREIGIVQSIYVFWWLCGTDGFSNTFSKGDQWTTDSPKTNKGNNKITEFRTILQRESQNT